MIVHEKFYSSYDKERNVSLLKKDFQIKFSRWERIMIFLGCNIAFRNQFMQEGAHMIDVNETERELKDVLV